MSWDCPNKVNETCTLNDTNCKPGTGKCVLKGKYEIAGQSGKSDRIATNDYSKDKKRKK